MNIRDPWNDEDIRTLVKMWNDNYPSAAIADAVNRKPSAIRQYICTHRHALGLKQRRRGDIRKYKNIPEFDKQWYGSVPFGHWTITKSWSKKQ